MSIKKDSVNMRFEQLTYKIKTGILKRTDKIILDGISGTFRAGELSVILGPSGSGKTTLLNILSGLVENGVEGTLTTDERSYKLIRNRSSYIMHDRMFHPLLTVAEAMSYAIKFKTGTITASHQQKDKCDAILTQLGLIHSRDTLTKNLSGGERKRLSIAVELVSDPLVLFLDEPTTGLDSFASSQFIKFLNSLAKSGKSIVCSIHTPSALMFQAFDHVYAIAGGKCIYQGSSGNMLSFLAELDLLCPESYNPADYLMEIATNQYGELNATLTDKIRNGLSEDYRNEMIAESITTNTKCSKYNSTFTYQLLWLIQRNVLFMQRNKNYVVVRFVVSIAIALLVGVAFYDVGHAANHIFDSYKFIYGITQFLIYFSFFSLFVRFPIDLPILRNEHFNRWYSSQSYYLALIISDIPVLVGVAIVHIVIAYYMTGQPMDQNRLLLIIIIGILLSAVIQAFGLLASSIGSNITISLVIGGAIVAVHILFSGVLILRKDVHPWLKWIFDIIVVNHANDGMVLALFGYNRTRMDCEDIYCHYRDPKEFLKLIGTPATIPYHMFFIIFFIVHGATFVIMMMKLKRINWL